MTTVSVNTYTHSVTYVADNILKSLKDIIHMSGLNPSTFVSGWENNSRAIRAWMDSQHLERVVLEIFNPTNNNLLFRWDIDIVYGWTGDGSFWTDTEALRYAIKKAGVAPSEAKYELILKNKPGYPTVAGWGDVDFRSTAGMVRQGVGSAVEHLGLGANASYWRKA
jgi:hypothetical protein